MTRRKTICGVNCYILFTRAEYHSLVFVICVKNLYDHYVIHLEMYDVFRFFTIFCTTTGGLQYV